MKGKKKKTFFNYRFLRQFANYDEKIKIVFSPVIFGECIWPLYLPKHCSSHSHETLFSSSKKVEQWTTTNHFSTIVKLPSKIEQFKSGKNSAYRYRTKVENHFRMRWLVGLNKKMDKHKTEKKFNWKKTEKLLCKNWNVHCPTVAVLEESLKRRKSHSKKLNNFWK